MARLVILGGGVAGHTAASYATKLLGKKHEVVVVTPNSQWNWIPSNIWVGAGRMSAKDVTFDLGKVYKKAGIVYKQAKAVAIHPEGSDSISSPFVSVEHTSKEKFGEVEEITYDFLINSTGPKLNFGATPGLGEGSNLGEHTVSVCTYSHAEHAYAKLKESIEKMKNGQRQKFLVGTGHGMCTCQGAAFEYLFNIEHEITRAGVRNMADIKWISNEYSLGDFGMGFVHINYNGFIASSKLMAESLFAERSVDWIIGAHVNKVEQGKISYELLDGTMGEETFDLAMLLPPFAGVGLKAFNKSGEDITDTVFAPSGFMKVDADYTQKDFDEWLPEDWPSTYQNPTYGNMFACGIAFAPPHTISKPMKSVNGTPITPTPPRTGMPSAVMAKAVTMSIADIIKGKSKVPTHKASMAKIAAACVASTGKGIFSGSAAAMTVYPIVPDYKKYPTGRDLRYTSGEVGLAGHWIKYILHHMFMYKAKLRPFWSFIPE
jgi:sulfide:quinone oxidoreductase